MVTCQVSSARLGIKAAPRCWLETRPELAIGSSIFFDVEAQTLQLQTQDEEGLMPYNKTPTSAEKAMCSYKLRQRCQMFMNQILADTMSQGNQIQVRPLIRLLACWTF